MLLADLAGAIATDDGARIVFAQTGLGRREANGRSFSVALAMTLESDDERYAWVNEALCVAEATGRRPPRRDARPPPLRWGDVGFRTKEAAIAITTETPLGLHGLNPRGPGLPAADDGAAVRARARARRGPPRRGRSARRRHRPVHGPVAEGQVRRPRAGLGGSDLVGVGQPAALRGAVRRAAREGRRPPRARSDAVRRRRVRRRGRGAPARRPRRHRPALPRPVREDDVHRAGRRRSSGRSSPRRVVLHAPEVEADPEVGRDAHRARSSCCTRAAARC